MLTCITAAAMNWSCSGSGGLRVVEQLEPSRACLKSLRLWRRAEALGHSERNLQGSATKELAYV